MKSRREREMLKYKITTGIIVGFTVLLIVVLLVINNSYKLKNLFRQEKPTQSVTSTTQDPALIEEERVLEVIAQARIIADGYDYAKAIEFIKADAAYRQTLKLLEEVESLEKEAKTMVKWSDVRTIPHVYVNTLIFDKNQAKMGSYKAMNYNSEYLTTTEFTAFLWELYKNDYVLVSIHDIAHYDEDKEKVVWGEIYLPEGKKPIVLSQENMCYSASDYGNGTADRLVIDAYGDLTCQIGDGADSTMGLYDLIPILEQFITEHPSFSYRGARALLGISGGDGLFGYNISDEKASDYSVNMDKVKNIAAKLKEMGFEFAFNGYDYDEKLCKQDYNTFTATVRKWKDDFAQILGSTDVVIFPNGDDIGDWRYYSGELYEFLRGEGFLYFVNSNDAEKVWNQITNSYIRQGRRCVCSNNLYYDYSGGGYFSDLCDAKKVYDYSGRDY